MPPLPPDVKNALTRQVPKAVRKDFERETKEKFKRIKQEMIKEFLGHPVTIEIMEGPSAANISGTLQGVTNLFAFIGFDEGDQPVLPIITLLESTDILYRKEVRTKGLGVSFDISFPTAEEIFAITPLPWATGRSWAEGIERGISGLGYLLRKSGGRSGAAVQSRVNKVRGGRFQNLPYISSFIKKYRKRFEQLK
ncbi:MAG TPA: hypothetical protein DCM40_40310 [Maribacter sp.]|jgi:hypothetical protein|nr:hypothetical protein [Maribacter sp.]|tara:strand:- start:8616 stop:9200 length:585 start_codon:yes stop_codon:yes gene_type:complete